MNMMLVLQNEGVSLLWSVKHIFVFKELKIVSLVGRLCSESEVLYIEWDQTQQQQKRLVSETSCTRCRQKNALTHIKHHPLCSYRSSFIFRLVRCNKNAFSSHFCRRRSISNIFPSPNSHLLSNVQRLGSIPPSNPSLAKTNIARFDVMTSLVEEVLAQLEPLDVKVALGRDVGELHGQPDVELLLELL